MAWRHIPSNQEAWELREAGLLRWKESGAEVYRQYSAPIRSLWSYEQWMTTRFDGVVCGKNYIQVDE